MLSIHDRYILALFLKILFFCILSLAVIFLLVDLFEKIDDFIDHEATAHHVLLYYIFKLPDILRLTLPVNIMLATIITLGVLGRDNEIIAFLASGVSMLRLTTPILLMALCAVLFATLLSESVVPRTNGRMLRLLRVEIQKREPQDARVRHGFVYHGEGDIHWYARTFNTKAENLRDITIYRYRQGRVLWHLHADTGTWNDSAWEFQNGFLRTFSPDSTGSGIREQMLTFFEYRMIELQETPEDLARLEPVPDAMNYVQLRTYVGRLRESGAEVNDYLVDLYTKLSYPLTSLIMAMLGIGLSASKRKPGLLTGVGVTLCIAFAYLALTEISEAMGKNETISPVLAAWLGPIFFGAASLGLFARVNR